MSVIELSWTAKNTNQILFFLKLNHPGYLCRPDQHQVLDCSILTKDQNQRGGQSAKNEDPRNSHNICRKFYTARFSGQKLHPWYDRILRALVIKTQKWVNMEKLTPLAKILHCRRQWQEWQISPLSRKCSVSKSRIHHTNLFLSAWSSLISVLHMFTCEILFP